ncbi:MAG TPA: hypothetical protein VJ717_16420 [Gemmatimonadaceae bacterium]|nr:hypothetical protein [Gemmatimonadaceae bacterium]
MRQRLIIGLLALSSIATACASGGSSSSPGTTNTATSTRRNPNLITQAEIAGAAGLENLYDVVERLRPNMLRSRGPAGRLSGASETSAGATASSVKVYLNGSPVGDVTALRSIQASNVKEVKFLSASEATTFFGTGVDSGAIVVTLR